MSDLGVRGIDFIELEIAQRKFVVKRSLELVRRLESVVGPLYPLHRRLAAGQCTVRELAAIFDVVTAGQKSRPRLAEMESYAFEVGVLGHAELSGFLVSLVAGETRRAIAVAELLNATQSTDEAQP